MNDNVLNKNLTESEKRGLEKLRKRIQSKEIVVIRTDKSGKMAIIQWELYQQMGEKHLGNDKVVTWDEIYETRNVIHGHLRVLTKVFKVGEDQGKKQIERTAREKQAATLTIPKMYLLIKDHKKWDKEKGELPKSR